MLRIALALFVRQERANAGSKERTSNVRSGGKHVERIRANGPRLNTRRANSVEIVGPR